jgi:shikimate dehydrogenase
VVRRDADGTLTGGMFDGEGFVAGLRHGGLDVAGRDALLLGAGGAASGIAHAVVSHGVNRLTIANRSMEKAQQLANLLQPHFPAQRISAGLPDAAHADLVINGTSLGMHEEDPLPIDISLLRPGTVVAEVVMQPDVTPLLQAAAARGCIIHKGIHMVQQQVQLLVDFLKQEARAV